MIMNYGTYKPTVQDVFVRFPVHAVMTTSLKKRVVGKKSDVYRNWLMFLKKKTLMDEYMIYTSVVAERAVEFDTYERLHDFCKEYSKFRVVMSKDRIYVNWVELYEEFRKFLEDGGFSQKPKKKSFWRRIFG